MKMTTITKTKKQMSLQRFDVLKEIYTLVDEDLNAFPYLSKYIRKCLLSSEPHRHR